MKKDQQPRLTKPTLSVLETLIDASSDNPLWGFRVCREADLGSSTVYPILDRLMQRGWVTSWDETEPHPGRPARRFYALTGAGRQHATAALAARRAHRVRTGLSTTGGAA